MSQMRKLERSVASSPSTLEALGLTTGAGEEGWLQAELPSQRHLNPLYKNVDTYSFNAFSS